jgi:galactose-1-phosphate uridylyltransferase
MDNNLLNIQSARKEDQIAIMKKIIADGVCPFCEQNLGKYHPKPILFKTKFWIVTHNAWPYEFTKNHFLLIYRPAHIEDSSQMNNHAYAEIKEIITKLNREHGLGSGTFLMRFGDMKKTGATVLHLHAQIIEGDSEHPNYDPQKGVITRVG